MALHLGYCHEWMTVCVREYDGSLYDVCKSNQDTSSHARFKL